VALHHITCTIAERPPHNVGVGLLRCLRRDLLTMLGLVFSDACGETSSQCWGWSSQMLHETSSQCWGWSSQMLCERVAVVACGETSSQCWGWSSQMLQKPFLLISSKCSLSNRISVWVVFRSTDFTLVALRDVLADGEAADGEAADGEFNSIFWYFYPRLCPFCTFFGTILSNMVIFCQ